MSTAIPGSEENIKELVESVKYSLRLSSWNITPLVEYCRELKAVSAWETWFSDEPKTWERMCRECIGYPPEFIAMMEKAEEIRLRDEEAKL